MVRPFSSMPRGIRTARRTSSRRRAISSERASRVRWVKVREIEGLLSRARIGLDLGTNRLPSAPVAPARDPGEHPLEDDGRERVAVGEVAVHGKADLAGAVGGAYPGALDPDPPPAEGGLAGLVAVAHGLSLGVMAALGADDLADLFFHQLGQHIETDADRQRHEPLLGDAHQLPERLLHPWRQRTLIARDGLRGRYVSLHGGSPFDLADRPEGSHWERTEQEDRRLQVLRATGQHRRPVRHEDGAAAPAAARSWGGLMPP